MWVNRSKRSPSRGVHEQSSDPGWTARYKTTGQWLVCVLGWADSAGCGCARAISKEARGSRGSAQRRGQGDEGPKAERWNGQCVDTST